MLRRPLGDGSHVANQRRYILALAVLLLSCIPLIDAQQQHHDQQQPLPQVQRVAQQPNSGSSRSEDRRNHHIDAISRKWPDPPSPDEFPATESNHLNQKAQKRYKKNPENIQISNDASAVATITLAPDQSVRAPSSRHRSSASPVGGSGLSSPQIARSLADWEVEDFVLLATVDGDLYAADRETGRERWHLEVEQPMVETKHYRLNVSELDDDHNPVDHYIWAVEPNRDGGLYVWIPDDSEPSLVHTGLTMKKLHDISPRISKDPPVTYTGTKKTTMVTLDAATGRVLKWFGSGGSQVNDAESCPRPNTLYDVDSEECASSGTINLGRTEYEVGIARADGRPIATLRYSEWVPNNLDMDLLQQYHVSLDNRYHTSQHDGKVYSFDFTSSHQTPAFSVKFPVPVARVFDVCRPWGATPESNPDLVVLPQPTLPAEDDTMDHVRSSSIFLNQTEGGSWYALSGQAYPLIIDAPVAPTSRAEWWEMGQQWDRLNSAQQARAMVGTHYLESRREKPSQPLSLPGASTIPDPPNDPDNDSSLPAISNATFEPPTIVDNLKSIPQQAANSVIDLLSNPVLIIAIVSALFFYQKELRRWYKGKTKQWFLQEDQSDNEATQDTLPAAPVEFKNQTPQPSPPPELLASSGLEDELKETSSATPMTPAESPLSTVAETAEMVENRPRAESESGGLVPEKKRGKAHRGRRGGVRHRKNKKGETSQSRDDEPPPATVEDAVNNAKKLGESPKLEPDVLTVANDMQAVTGPIIRMGNIEVNTEDQLGTGSNGTLVFAGKFDGREVAVKRMLIQFYDIASQETRLLRESDDHPNVIRYYAQQIRDGFLYIALERCAASLADVVEKPYLFSDLAQAGKRDLPGVLYQITNGIHHLHNLRIVHRDLKPQNILINMGKDGRPRLLVSDFGLCKKLESNQSSFGATTGRAAGTSGWRAPELLLDDDVRDSTIDASTHSGSGSILAGSDAMTNRRATRSIDIFSLGLVFFYVLTNGSHPFDCGDRYMREVNIRKGNYNLGLLDSLGDFAYEAKDLISAMLNADPKRRPPARDVMAHPFFWSAKKRLAFLCDVSDHFEKEPRDPPSPALQELERHAPMITKGDFLRALPREFVDSLGKQRKYTGSRLLDLLRALRNKKNHYEDMSESLKRTVGPLPDGYLAFWTVKFPKLLLVCWDVVYSVEWESTDRFREYYEPAGL